MSNIKLSFEKDGSEGLIHNVSWGRKGTQNGVARILGYQVLFFGSSSRGSFYYSDYRDYKDYKDYRDYRDYRD